MKLVSVVDPEASGQLKRPVTADRVFMSPEMRGYLQRMPVVGADQP